MKLGDNVCFLDTDGCNVIRKGTVTRISQYEGYVDFLSSRSNKTCTGTKYTVCAKKNGFYQFFEPDKIFTSIQAVKDYLAETTFKKFDILE